LKRFRQSVLAAACSGRLTEDWRYQQSRADAHEVLTTIEDERKAVQPRTSRTFKEEDAAEIADPVTWSVPETWAWAPVSKLLAYDRRAAYGVLQPGANVTDGVPLVRVCDLLKGTVDTRRLKRIAR